MNTASDRQRLRQKRQLPTWQRYKRERKLCLFALQLPALKRAKYLACYLATPNEAPSLKLLHALHARGKQVFVPIVRGTEMYFVTWHPHSKLKKGAFGISEPKRFRASIKAKHLNLVYMPLLGFDRWGNRLGMGGGFYDRSFAFKNQGYQKPLLAGYAYGAQEVNQLKSQTWDVAMDCLVTDKQYRQCLPKKIKNC